MHASDHLEQRLTPYYLHFHEHMVFAFSHLLSAPYWHFSSSTIEEVLFVIL